MIVSQILKWRFLENWSVSSVWTEGFEVLSQQLEETKYGLICLLKFDLNQVNSNSNSNYNRSISHNAMSDHSLKSIRYASTNFLKIYYEPLSADTTLQDNLCYTQIRVGTVSRREPTRGTSPTPTPERHVLPGTPCSPACSLGDVSHGVPMRGTEERRMWRSRGIHARGGRQIVHIRTIYQIRGNSNWLRNIIRLFDLSQ